MTDPATQETGDRLRNGRPLSLELAWDVLKELTASERHFNQLETEYRKLASIWLLAGFAGMGFILKEETKMALAPEAAMMAIGMATSIGIFILWIVDLLVYHRLLHACFEQAKKMEKSYPEFPGVRAAMEGTQGRGMVVTRWLRWFYVSLTAAPVIFSAPLFFGWCQINYGLVTAIVTTGAAFLYLILTTFCILTISRSSPSAVATERDGNG
jgi:hypothetical protein